MVVLGLICDARGCWRWLCFGFWVVLVVCLVGLLVAGWFGALLGFGAVFLFGYSGCCVVLFAGFRVLVWKLCLLLCFK